MTEVLKVPSHVGIIPDGNRRWAADRRLPPVEGHRRGYQRIKEIAGAAMNIGVEYLSFYGFSTENQGRPDDEVNGLMKVMLTAARMDVGRMHRQNIRLRFPGSEEGMDPKVLGVLKKAEERTAENTGLQLIACVNYGGKAEITDAVKAIVTEGIPAGDIDEDTVAGHLYLPDVPGLDLVIRTSGEQRLSGFMPWQTSYAELAFPDVLWPDFTPDHFVGCIEDFGNRQRRFGG